MRRKRKKPVPDNINVYLKFSTYYQEFLKRISFGYWLLFIKSSFAGDASPTEYLEEKNVAFARRETCFEYFHISKEQNEALMKKAKSLELTYYSLFCGILVKSLEQVYDLPDDFVFSHAHAISLRKFLKEEHMLLLSSFAGTAAFRYIIKKDNTAFDYANVVYHDMHKTTSEPLGVPAYPFFQSYGDNYYTFFARLLMSLYNERKDNRDGFLFTSNMGAFALKIKYPLISVAGGPNFNAGSLLLSVYLTSVNGEGWFGVSFVKPYVSVERIEEIRSRFMENLDIAIEAKSED